MRSRVDVELPAGDYRVRRYLRNQEAWELHKTESMAVKTDSWVYHFGCAP